MAEDLDIQIVKKNTALGSVCVVSTHHSHSPQRFQSWFLSHSSPIEHKNYADRPLLPSTSWVMVQKKKVLSKNWLAANLNNLNNG